jgi:hypothetical protein
LAARTSTLSAIRATDSSKPSTPAEADSGAVKSKGTEGHRVHGDTELRVKADGQFLGRSAVVPVGRYDSSAHRGQRPGDGRTNTSAGPRDQGSAFGELSVPKTMSPSLTWADAR